MDIYITKRIEFDAGHRLLKTDSICRNFHGHRWVLEATVAGSMQGHEDDGMLVDLHILKHVMERQVGERWDHSIILEETDITAVNAMRGIERQERTVTVPFPPTLENLTREAFRLIETELRHTAPHVKLTEVRLSETPNQWARVLADS